MTHTYYFESFYCGAWIRLLSDSLHFLRGYLHAKRDHSPRLAYRIVRGDGKIIDEVTAREDVSIGLVAGWPTPEQYEQAAAKALEMAKAIREREKAQNRTGQQP